MRERENLLIPEPAAAAGGKSRLTVPGSAHPILKLQRLVGNRAVQRFFEGGTGAGPEMPDIAAAIQRGRGHGEALQTDARVRMESTLGADFSGVRVHTGADADVLSRDLEARAFTTGKDIYFREGAYRPGTSGGLRLLAHELTHVVQQSGAGEARELTVGAPGDEFEREADHVASHVESAAASLSLGSRGSAPAAIQRTPEEDAEERKKAEAAQKRSAFAPVPSAPRATTPRVAGISQDTVTRIANFTSLIDSVAAETHVPANVIRGIIAAESSGKPETGAGTRGYKGLMQSERTENQLDPETSIRAGSRKYRDFQNSVFTFLRNNRTNPDAMDSDTRVGLVMTAYNAGPGTFQQAAHYALASGNINAWNQAENFKRALVHYGAYSTSPLPGTIQRLGWTTGESLAGGLATLPGNKLSSEEIQRHFMAGGKWNLPALKNEIEKAVERERHLFTYDYRRKAGLEPNDPTLQQFEAQASPLLQACVAFKHRELPGSYIPTILRYEHFFSGTPAVPPAVTPKVDSAAAEQHRWLELTRENLFGAEASMMRAHAVVSASQWRYHPSPEAVKHFAQSGPGTLFQTAYSRVDQEIAAGNASRAEGDRVRSVIGYSLENALAFTLKTAIDPGILDQIMIWANRASAAYEEAGWHFEQAETNFQTLLRAVGDKSRFFEIAQLPSLQQLSGGRI